MMLPYRRPRTNEQMNANLDRIEQALTLLTADDGDRHARLIFVTDSVGAVTLQLQAKKKSSNIWEICFSVEVT